MTRKSRKPVRRQIRPTGAFAKKGVGGVYRPGPQPWDAPLVQAFNFSKCIMTREVVRSKSIKLLKAGPDSQDDSQRFC